MPCINPLVPTSHLCRFLPGVLAMGPLSANIAHPQSCHPQSCPLPTFQPSTSHLLAKLCPPRSPRRCQISAFLHILGPDMWHGAGSLVPLPFRATTPPDQTLDNQMNSSLPPSETNCSRPVLTQPFYLPTCLRFSPPVSRHRQAPGRYKPHPPQARKIHTQYLTVRASIPKRNSGHTIK